MGWGNSFFFLTSFPPSITHPPQLPLPNIIFILLSIERIISCIQPPIRSLPTLGFSSLTSEDFWQPNFLQLKLLGSIGVCGGGAERESMRSHFHTPLHFRTVDDLKPISAEMNARSQASRPGDSLGREDCWCSREGSLVEG